MKTPVPGKKRRGGPVAEADEPKGARLADGSEASTPPPAAPVHDELPPVRHSVKAGKRSFGLLDVLWFPFRLLLRLFFPKLLDRYIQGELLVPLGFGWTLFIVLYVFSVNLFKLAQMAARGAPLNMIGEMLWLRVILACVYCLPMAMLLSGLLAFGRLSGESELIAIQAGGIPNIRVIWNAFVLGLALSVGGIAINEYIVPPAGKRLHMLEDQVKAILKGRMIEDMTDQKAFIIQDFEGGKLARVVISKKFEPENPPDPARMEEVTYISYAKGQPETIVQARRAEWIGPDRKDASKQQWKFIDATTQILGQVTKGEHWVMHSPELMLQLNKSPQQVARDQKDADQMSYRELGLYINDLKRQHARTRVVREFEVERERKLAVPFASLILALVGAPLGIRRHRSTTGVGIGLSLLIIIVYYIGMSFLGALGENAQMEPMVAAWGCNVIGLVVGLFLTARSSR